MPVRRITALLMVGLFSLTASGAAVVFHHDHACASSHDPLGDCRTCYLLTAGRTALADSPVVVPNDAELVGVAAPAQPDAPFVAERHTDAAPRAPPAC